MKKYIMVFILMLSSTSYSEATIVPLPWDPTRSITTVITIATWCPTIARIVIKTAVEILKK